MIVRSKTRPEAHDLYRREGRYCAAATGQASPATQLHRDMSKERGRPHARNEDGPPAGPLSSQLPPPPPHFLSLLPTQTAASTCISSAQPARNAIAL
jgi:hypothetical protein